MMKQFVWRWLYALAWTFADLTRALCAGVRSMLGALTFLFASELGVLQGKTTRHHVLNDAIARCFGAAGVPVKKEPSGLLFNDSKRPDGLTLIPWRAGKPLAWDVTVAHTLAESYIRASSSAAGAAANMAAARKESKYSDLPASVIFQPLAFETLGPIDESAVDCLVDLGRRVTANSGEVKETTFLFQRLSVIIQRFNAILLHDTFVTDVDPDL